MPGKRPIRLVDQRASKTLDDLDDDDLMLLAKSGRQDAFAVVLRRYQPLIFGIATRFLADRELGRDVMQDVMLSLWKERKRYRGRGRFRSFIAAMTIHRCQMVARSQKRQDRRVADLSRAQQALPNSQPLPLDVVVEQERSRELRALLARVPEKQRQVLVLRFAEGLTLDEIANATRQPLGTVKSHLFRGLKKLRQLWQKESSP